MNMKTKTWLLGLLTVALGTPTGVQAQKLLGQPGKFPIVISKSGSYRLRANITVPNADGGGIELGGNVCGTDMSCP